MGRKKNKQIAKVDVSNSERNVPDTLNIKNNLQDTLMELSTDESNNFESADADNRVASQTFEKRLQLLDIPSQIDKLTRILKIYASEGGTYVTLDELPFNISNIHYSEYPQLADYLSKILGIGVYYFNQNDYAFSGWVFYWHDISQRGDSLPYPEVSENDLENELKTIEKDIKLHKAVGNEMCYNCNSPQQVKYCNYFNYGSCLKYKCQKCYLEQFAYDEGACEFYDTIPNKGFGCNLM